MKKQGRITANGVLVQQHEMSTVVFLTQQGFDVALIPPQRRKGAHTPDIHMQGLDWEMKRPKGQSAHTIKRAFKTASRQSVNIIFDLRSSKMPDEVNLPKLEKEFADLRSVRRLIIITKDGTIIDKTK
ncbi:hypothetical protein [Actinomyces massiliensis]|jgi:hypothetical protein|uniref:CdiA C-terminal domain-containing protein n=1 Tax=Actinomyces massiliensis TaxID=461393 RepID=UPI0028E209B1|nr:hypothetical protein [Actinomyces massiliensis]